ncbi:phosphodiester glycosidase family protein [Fictibacillus enclensis]|uniref:phosphodiester glycosidase family protein n=1 Tax=Fictibacillus enclensis TaxID=1017270 RepID=UPI0025A18F21|nr:phosphodiester glycosidase family protein [Fictibacillus enclensis]
MYKERGRWDLKKYIPKVENTLDRNFRNTVNDMVDNINETTKDIDDVKLKTEKAVQDSTDAKTTANSIQTQLNGLVLDGDSSVEAAQARVDEEGVVYDTLKERIDEGFVKVDNTLQETPYYDEISFTREFDSTSSTTYYITKIPQKDSKGNLIQLQHGYANDVFGGGGKGETPRSFSNRHMASVAINASTFDTTTLQPRGIQIANGVVLQQNINNVNTRMVLGIKADNTLVSYTSDTPTSQILADGCVHALVGFHPMIQNGVAVDPSVYASESNSSQPNPRQAIAQLPNKDILILSTEGRTVNDVGMTYADMIRILLAKGASFAYNLDGGGSTSTVFRGFTINNPIDDSGKTERPVSDFLYVKKPATYPEAFKTTNTDIGMIKKMVTDAVADAMAKKDFFDGYIRLKSPDGFLYGGIEAWEGKTRYAKLTLNKNYILYNDYVNDKELFKVDSTGNLKTQKGTLGNFFNNLSAISDFNTIKDTGFYWGIGNGTTANLPANDISWGLLHFQVGSSQMQVAFPYHSSAYGPRSRRTDTNKSSGWSDWREL